jgi:hypothetical protein
MPAIALPVSYGATRSVKNSGGVLVNAFAEQAPEDAKSPITLFGMPGLEKLLEIPGERVRHGIVVNDSLYVWTNLGLHKVYSDGTSKKLGDASLSYPIRTASNGLNIAATDGTKAFYYTISDVEDNPATVTVVYEITDPAFTPAYTVAHLDGYLAFDKRSTNQVVNTEPLSMTIDPLAFLSAEMDWDNVSSVVSVGRELWVLGTRSYEVWYNAGLTPSPWQRHEGAGGAGGAASPYASAELNGAMIWLGHDGQVRQGLGLQARIISTPAIIEAIRTKDLSKAEAFSFSILGHDWWVLTVESLTLIYDQSTNLWFQVLDPVTTRYRLGWAVHVYGRVYAGHYNGPEIYEVTPDAYDFDGVDFTTTMTLPTVHRDRALVRHTQLEVDLDVGQGLEGALPGDAPPIMEMRYSNDGGKTWSAWLARSMGKDGEYLTRMRWQRLGDARQRTYQLRTSAAVKRALASRAFVEVMD